MTFKKLEEIAEIYTGIRTTRYENKEGNIEKVLIGKIEENTPKYENIKISKINKKYYSQKNDIIIHLTDTTNITILDEENIIIPLNYAIIRTKSKYNPKYIYQILRSTQFQKAIDKIKEGSGVQFIKINNLKEIKIKVTENEKTPEYIKLAELIEEKIKLQKLKIKKEEEYQNAILQTQIGEKYVKL